ncbi:MAG: carbohydrate-binding domain-containing protein [Eggerthellaceae bacterium]|nr:carbohydrate-binding domain-containing protein [Eggerthellaceae bacterium]
MAKRAISVFLSFVLAVGLCPSLAFADNLAAAPADALLLSTQAATLEYNAELSFSDSGITETKAGSGYTISGTTLTIDSAGTYRLSGSCNSGNVVVKASLSDVTLVLDGLTLASSSTAPIVVKKNTAASIHLEGTSTLTDNENPANETSSDATVADAFEGACVKVKSGSAVTFCGEGNLNIVANAKNGIKGGSTAALTFNQSGTISVTGSGAYYGTSSSGAAVNNGIASDGSLTFNRGTYIVKAAGDGLKSTPDATDATEGTTIDTESAGTITINGGTFDLDVDGDGIQADTALTIANGTFDIQTWKGYSTWNDTLANANSCKGLKASGDRATEAGTSPTLTVTGGTFTLNCGDDAIHSDAYATVTGGTFDIRTGDDGMHADTSLILGTQGSSIARDPDVTVRNSYEGLEGGTVYLYSGRYHVTATDDGVNAAGGSSSGTDAGGPGGSPGNPWGNDGFNPGGGRPGGFGRMSTQATSDYNIYIAGGSLYVNCAGDGLDSNGGLYLTGGTQEIFSVSSGDNTAIDADGTVSINGATIFTAGANPMMDPVQTSWFGSSQKYGTASSNLSSGTAVNATVGSSVAYSTTLPKSASFFMYSAPGLSSAPTVSSASIATACKGGSWSHSWNSGTTSGTTKTYTCTSCGATETQTIAATTSVSACTHTAHENSGSESADAGYAVTFAGDSGVKGITAYDTSTYTSATTTSLSATGATVSRNSSTGAADSTGDGQVNFTVVLNDGYELSSVTATDGTYKNIKGPDDTGLANTYRITKITGATTVTITTKATTAAACEHGSVSAPTWSWSTGYAGAQATFTCTDCGESFTMPATVTSTTSGNATTYTASVTYGGTTYTDAKTVNTGSAATSIPLADCTISAPSQVYTGKALTPVKVTYNGKTLTENVDYKVTYSNNKLAGKAKATVSGIAKNSGTSYTGTRSISFTIKPAKVTGVKVKSTGSGKAKVTWSNAKALKAKASGYQIYYKSGSTPHLVTVAKASVAKKALKGLANGKKVKVKIRAFTTSGSSRIYGAWSKAASVSVK